MWTIETRPRYNRDKLRYPSDLPDNEWVLIEPLIPAAKRGGNKRRVNLREVVNVILYVLSTGGRGGAILKNLPPRGRVFAYLDLWIYYGTLDRMHHPLYEAGRERAGREAPRVTANDDRRADVIHAFEVGRGKWEPHRSIPHSRLRSFAVPGVAVRQYCGRRDWSATLPSPRVRARGIAARGAFRSNCIGKLLYMSVLSRFRDPNWRPLRWKMA
jgi:transposase